MVTWTTIGFQMGFRSIERAYQDIKDVVRQEVRGVFSWQTFLADEEQETVKIYLTE